MKQQLHHTICNLTLILLVALLNQAAVAADQASAQPPRLDPGGLTAVTLKPFEDRHPRPGDVAVAVWPTSILDAQNTHHLAQNQPTIMILALANPQARPLAEARLVVDLPDHVELFWTNAYLNWEKLETTSIQHAGLPYTRHTLPLTVHPTTFPNTQSGNTQGFYYKRPPALWLKTSASPGDSLGEVHLQLQYKQRTAHSSTDIEDVWADSPITSVRLKAVAPAHAHQPLLIQSGVMGRFILNGGRQPDKATAIHEWLTELGYNFVIRGIPTAKPLNHLAIWQETQVQNVYRTGGDVPSDAAFIVNGQPLPGVVTPAAIYRKDDWFVRNILDKLDQQAAAGTLGTQWTNHEPYAYLDKWDESVRNRDEFIAWSGLDASAVIQAWPGDVAKTFPGPWKQFQNWQVGQATRTLAQHIHNLGERQQHDVRLVYSTSQDAIAGEPGYSMNVAAWGDMPAVMQTWCFYQIPKLGLIKEDRLGSAHLGRARWLFLRAREMFSENHQLALSLIYGWDQTHQGYFYPEQLGFLHESTVLAGLKIVHNYAEFPLWDARYAHAIANANEQISRWETFIANGQSRRTHVLLPIASSGMDQPQPITPQSQEVTQDVSTQGDLFSFEYALNDKTLIAIANTSTIHEAFATLRVEHLDDDAKYMLSDPKNKRILISDATKTSASHFITGKQLRDGIVVHLPALQWTCLLLEPYTAKVADMHMHSTVLGANQLLPLVPGWMAQLAATQLQQKTIAQENFDDTPLGVHGQGKHGEKLADTMINIGYPSSSDLSQNFVQIVAQQDMPQNHALELVRNHPRNNIYVAVRAVHQDGAVNFNLTPVKPGPFRITLSAYLAELRVLDEKQWTHYFGDKPYQPNFIYIQGNDTPMGKGVDTGIAATMDTTFNITLDWTADRKCTVTIDGQKVIDNLSFKVTKYNVESVVWGLDPGTIQSSEISAIRIDDIRILKH